MNRQGMIELGKSLEDNLNDEQAYKKGINNFVVSPADLQRICDENINFRNNTIIVVSNSSNDGASSLQKHYALFENDQNSQLDAVRKSIYCLSQAIFSSNTSDRKYFLGLKQTDNKETVIKKCGSLKPCIHGSDAHSEDTLFAPDNNMYCWIKSNPTFEGLKQIIFEPEDRVYIGAQKPEEKKSYFVIDKVCFLDNRDNPSFSSEPIEINQNLTAITGGKSTGKSLLLYYMARTINRQEVENRFSIEGMNNNYNLEETLNFNFEVTWKDGQSTFLKSLATNSLENELKDRKILYIPQRYLNTLSETNIKSKNALNEFVLDLILQNSAINEKYQQTKKEIQETIKSITSEIGNLYSEQAEIKKIEEEIIQIGDEKGIESYIQTLQKQTDEIKTKSGLTNEQIKQYEDLALNETRINKDLSSLQEDKKTINNLRANLNAQINNIRSAIIGQEKYLQNSEVRHQFSTEFQRIINDLNGMLESSSSNLTTAIDEKIKIYQENLSEIKNNIDPLLDKVKLQSQLQEKTTALKNEKQKLNDISIKKNNLKTKKSFYEEKINLIVKQYKEIIILYDKLQKELKKFDNQFGEISLSVHLNFNETDFNSEAINFINKNNLKKIILSPDRGDDSLYKYDASKHVTIISSIFNGILSGEINTSKSKSPKDVAIKLFEDYFYLDFKIFFKSDSLDKMSPGKKGACFTTATN